MAATSQPDEPGVEEQPAPDLRKPEPEREAGVGEDSSTPGPDSDADSPVRWWQRKPLAWDPPAAPLVMRWRAPAPDLTRRRRHLLYNGAAAAVGWWSGLGPWCQHLIADFGHGSVRDGLTCGALCLFAALPIDLRTHAWRGAGYPLVRALGWVGRIPLATAVVAVALYGPDAVL
ncbi:hypothetical protein [Peterkaempfera griseoplana]|uniref:hypothetical protein n=1 Tax=Peterkaempfera griseoplana TaxID=66896 RepID=UPI0006E1711F|nr:hypothetical protein [Peterkaempfera griseoplana]